MKLNLKSHPDSIGTNLKYNRGFTLVELLSSILILVAAGSVIAGIVTSSLRGANKTNTIENIRQSGNYTLSLVSKNIEYAQVFNGLSTDGTTYVTSCPFSLSPTPVPVTTNYKFIKVTPPKGPAITYNCTSSVPLTITQNGESLVNTNSMSLTECTIACIQTRATSIPIIKVSFKLGPKNPSGLVENTTPPILFETSVTIRNYKK